MKKNNLITGILYIAAGMALLAAALLTDTKLDSLLFGFAGALTAPGIVMICRYFYWNRPENRLQYQERLERERVEFQDELKVKLRDRSGRYAYVAGLIVISFSIVAFSVLGALEIVGNVRMIVLFLGGYLLFQIAIGIVAFHHLLKRYL